MTRRVTFRPAAEADLDAIFDYIAQDSLRHALLFTRRIRARCESLAEYPEQGTRRDDFATGVRIIGFERRVTIAFRVFSDRVQIVAISYGGRDLVALLEKRQHQ